MAHVFLTLTDLSTGYGPLRHSLDSGFHFLYSGPHFMNLDLHSLDFIFHSPDSGPYFQIPGSTARFQSLTPRFRVLLLNSGSHSQIWGLITPRFRVHSQIQGSTPRFRVPLPDSGFHSIQVFIPVFRVSFPDSGSDSRILHPTPRFGVPLLDFRFHLLDSSTLFPDSTSGIMVLIFWIHWFYFPDS